MCAPHGMPSGLSPEQTTRANAIMLGKQREQRAAYRSLVRLPVTIKTSPSDPTEHVGLLMDLHRRGIFFYSDFMPRHGAHVEFLIVLRRTQRKAISVACQGKVVRVEEAAPGAAIGIALSVENYKLVSTSLS